MTLKEWNIKMMRDDTMHRILPLEWRKSYPYFTLEKNTLCLSFACFKTKPEQGQIRVYYPSCFLKVSYPDNKLLSFERISYGDDVPESHIMNPKEKESIEKLITLCDAVFKAFDESLEGLNEILSEYNKNLLDILETDQAEIIKRFSNI